MSESIAASATAPAAGPTTSTSTETEAVRRPASAWSGAAARILPGVLSILAGLVAWQLFSMFSTLPAYLLPSPKAVALALVDGLTADPRSRSSFIFHLSNTLKATLMGFGVATVLGVSLAAAMSESRLIERMLWPYVIGFQSLPKVAVAPLFIIWFGFQIESKVAIAAAIALFPILLNSFIGFTSIERDRRELLASLRASRWQVFRFVKFPGALPFIFAGVSLGIVYAFLGAIVAEFIGSQVGLGVIIIQLQTVSDTAGVFALLILSGVTGFILIGAIRLLQRRVLFWSGGDNATEIV